jgi:hypothetical protein
MKYPGQDTLHDSLILRPLILIQQTRTL